MRTDPRRSGGHAVEVAEGTWAWLQPDGSWGWSNAGLVTDGDATLLVDTLYDLDLTRRMLEGFAALGAAPIDTVVNTHSNGDHCNGNELVADARIIASAATADEMGDESPELMVALLEAAPTMGVTGEFFAQCFGAFDFAGITPTPPHETFSGRLELNVGATRIDLVEVGPAHTRGDVLVHVPERRTVFTGDIVFSEGHPILWEGPVDRLLAAFHLIRSWAPEVVVPGHGPLTDLAGIDRIDAYVRYCRDTFFAFYDEGMDVETAAREIRLDRWAGWGDPERIVIMADTCHRDWVAARHGTRPERTPVTELFAAMARWWDERREPAPPTRRG
ncbi:MAG: MBL fold metallo-hydrolase [Actinomyces sp.]|nr:MAG: MBL fold metallo-hydrolase [Actinomyces sp.]